MNEVYERTTYERTARLVEEATGEIVPLSTARYRVTDDSSGSEILGWTDLAIADDSVFIEITPEQNRIVCSGLAAETHIITVEFAYGLNKAAAGEHRFIVKALKGERHQ